MQIFKTNVIFFIIILMTGVLTVITDLKTQKIYNNHLIISAILGLMAAAFRHEDALFHLINGFAAFMIGILLHKSSLWRGGDAKLFTIYAFLMPVPVYNLLPLPCVINLFACSFIAGLIIFLPIFIKDIIINHQAISRDLSSPTKIAGILNGAGSTLLFSWVFFPFFYIARLINPIIVVLFSYLVYNWAYTPEIKLNLRKILPQVFLGLIFGYLMRLWLFPVYLSPGALMRFILMIALSTVLSTGIHTTFNHFKDYHQRVPFAPLLFIGCILSYTPFLITLMHVMARWNVLLYR